MSGRLLERGLKVTHNGIVEQGVWRDGEWVEPAEVKVSPNFLDWSTSLKTSSQSALRTFKDAWGNYSFGLLNKSNNLHGRGVQIDRNGTIIVGYFVDGSLSVGNYIYVYTQGTFIVGESIRVSA